MEIYMKKQPLKSLSKYLPLVLFLTAVVICLVVKIMNVFCHAVNVDTITLLVNCEYNDGTDSDILESELYRLNVNSETLQKEKILSEYGNVLSTVYLSNGEKCLLIKSNAYDSFLLSIMNSENKAVYECDLDFIPDQILEYNDGLLLRNNDSLIFWKFRKNSSITSAEFHNDYCAEKIWSNGKEIVYKWKENTYLYGDESQKTIKSNWNCLGFSDDKTVVFEKDLPMGFCLICKYSIDDDKYYSYQLLHIPGYIVSQTAFSPDGKYMMFFSSDGEGGLKTYILDMKYYTKKKLDSEIYALSFQWL